jgi:hypothetical protein
MKIKFYALCLLGVSVTALVLTGDFSSGQFSSAQAQPADMQPAAAAPPDILPDSPLAEVIKLVQSGVDESIITAYINNSGSTFNLDADKIIYLDNVGVPKDLVTAMMQRDQSLQAQVAAASPQPAPPAPETVTTDVAPEPDVVTVDYFQTTLQPYGNWVDVEGYGRCWRPTVTVYNSGWQPYCDRGHWVDSDSGWYWVSDYSWGVTFHYGRWFHHARFGWVWWPDTVWAPSWVTWRYADDYCGWAPLPPFTVWQPGVGFAYRGNGISVGFDFGLAADNFIFVPTSHFCDERPRRYRCAPAEVTRIYNHTTVINNYNFDSHNRTFINNGIPVQHIAAASHVTIRPVAARELRASTERPWQVGSSGAPAHKPVTATGNAPRTGSVFENRNNPPARSETTAPNRFSPPANNPNPQPNRSWPENSPVQPRNYDDDKHITSPHGQQLETQTPHPTQPLQNREFTAPVAPRPVTPPVVNNSLPAQSVDTRREERVEARQNNSEPAARTAPPPAPAPVVSSPSSSSSGRSDRQNQNQNQNGR